MCLNTALGRVYFWKFQIIVEMEPQHFYSTSELFVRYLLSVTISLHFSGIIVVSRTFFSFQGFLLFEATKKWKLIQNFQNIIQQLRYTAADRYTNSWRIGILCRDKCGLFIFKVWRIHSAFNTLEIRNNYKSILCTWYIFYLFHGIYIFDGMDYYCVAKIRQYKKTAVWAH